MVRRCRRAQWTVWWVTAGSNAGLPSCRCGRGNMCSGRRYRTPTISRRTTSSPPARASRSSLTLRASTASPMKQAVSSLSRSSSDIRRASRRRRDPDMEHYADYLRSKAPRPEDLPHSAHYHAWTPESITRFWQVWANNQYLRSQYYPRHYFEAFLAKARPHLGTVGVVADIGCGTGTMLSILTDASIGRQFVGIDLSEESLT